MGTRALVLFAHGARSQEWRAPFERLRELVQARMPEVPVSLAFLELMEPRLPEHIAALAIAGMREIGVVPVFLGQGGHVRRDLPPMLDELRARHPGVRITLAQAVGEDAAVLNAMADYCARAAGIGE